MLEIVLGIVGVTTGVLSVFTTYTKLQNVLKHLEIRDIELNSLIDSINMKLEHQGEKTELLFNGVRERVEHINTRLSNQLRDSSGVTKDIEGYLVKNTTYESRLRES